MSFLTKHTEYETPADGSPIKVHVPLQWTRDTVKRTNAKKFGLFENAKTKALEIWPLDENGEPRDA